ncbi:hypothetical protein K1T35_00350 [Pseudonocardia sp. DSM 110487]|uniref:hypothetical protein n=1 Tax=Pseudonocardia sp. DSM 110487 TaxID=2865833 RepID=UPI001C6989F1|nr:hypothetical protein [Pseudonocardia sp. DSM 110487]QYN35861.1 hypothetical protein K1T35_00350 [Pseudonocardia sp. DSM 110487]
MTTFTDGAPPSVTPEPDDGSVPHRAEAPDADPETGSAWLQDEIQRRIAEKAAAGGGGRHARRGEPTSSSSAEYIARHSVATPGPGAPRPGPVGGQMSQASELLRRERTEGTSAQPVWSGPPIRPGGVQPAPSPSDREAGTDTVRPGIAAAAAMRGAARGRARKAAAAAAPPVAPMPPADAPQAPPHPGAAAPTDAPQQDPSATTPVETALVHPAPVETAPPHPAPPHPAPPNPVPPSAAPTGPLPAPPPQAAAAPPAPTGPIPPVASPPDATDTRPSMAPDPVAAELTAPVPAVPPAAADEEPSDDPEPVGRPVGRISVPAQRRAELHDAPPPDPDAPADQPGKRVRVVLAERKSVARPVRTVITIQEPTGVGELLRSNLIGSQLAIALRFAIGAGLTLGLLPLLFAMVPEIGRVEVLGIRLPWLLLGVLVYPFLFGLGLWHTRTAEHLEQNFAETVQD